VERNLRLFSRLCHPVFIALTSCPLLGNPGFEDGSTNPAPRTAASGVTNHATGETNSSGTVLATLATYSNLNKNTGYAQKTFDLSAYKGQTIKILLTGVEDASLQTSFVLDDFSLTVQ